MPENWKERFFYEVSVGAYYFTAAMRDFLMFLVSFGIFTICVVLSLIDLDVLLVYRILLILSILNIISIVIIFGINKAYITAVINDNDHWVKKTVKYLDIFALTSFLCELSVLIGYICL